MSGAGAPDDRPVDCHDLRVAVVAARWHDPAFPAGFPFVGEARWWEQHVTDLQEALDRLA